MQKLPGLVLRIALLEQGKKFRVSKMLQARSVISHVVLLSWDKEHRMAVAVLALVHAGVVAQVGRRAIAGHSALAKARDGGGVVRASGDGGVGDRKLFR